MCGGHLRRNKEGNPMLHVPARRRARHPRPRPDVRVAAALARMRLAIGADIDLVPTAEIADIKDSSLSTPYNAWALAARYRQRAFVFWTYVSALAEDPLVRVNAEDLARKVLSDGNLLRRERRLAWRAERRIGLERRAQRLMTESTSLRRPRCWRAFSSR